MEIVEIYEPWIYSIQFDEDDLNEYDKVIEKWHDLDYLTEFFTTNAEYMNNPIWASIGLSPSEPEKSAERVIDESEKLEDYIEQLVENAEHGVKPDLEAHFHFLNGKYSFVCELAPMKAYSTLKPSLLRLYAIRLEENCFLIVYGGIKLADTIQNSPDLKDNVIQKLDKVLAFLKREGITERDDI
ncbi:MAG: hypothetical protein MJZ29_00660 [Bacteroidaceae bacterium]|nr:hypothetical protein [Bacteroidaceae bacterium]